MQFQVKPTTVSLYDTDYQQWLDATVQQLQSCDFDNLDLENLIEEMKVWANEINERSLAIL